MTDESKLRFLDARLDGEGLQGLLKGIMDSEDYGKNAVEIVQNVDIQSIDALTGYKGNRRNTINS